MSDHVPHTLMLSYEPFWCSVICPQQACAVFALVYVWVPPMCSCVPHYSHSSSQRGYILYRAAVFHLLLVSLILSHGVSEHVNILVCKHPNLFPFPGNYTD